MCIPKAQEGRAMTELQDFTGRYELGISAKELADKAYNHMAAKGHRVCIVNERYLEVDGTTYLFRKSRKNGRWEVKTF